MMGVVVGGSPSPMLHPPVEDGIRPQPTIVQGPLSPGPGWLWRVSHHSLNQDHSLFLTFPIQPE